MPTVSWDTVTIDGQDYWVIPSTYFRVPKTFDPNSGMFLAVAAPDIGTGAFPAAVQGDPGLSPTFDTPAMHALAYSDATPDSVSFTLVTPGTTSAGPVYHADFFLHTGAPGADGTMTLLDAADLVGTPTAGQIIVVNPSAAGFVYQSQKVGGWYNPAVLNSTPSGNPSYTLGQISVPAQPFDWRPTAKAECIITATAADTRVDLLARLNDASAGNEVGRALGQTGINPATHVLMPGPPAGSTDSYDKVSAGAAATIYLRAERQLGTGTFTTAAVDTRFRVKVDPVP